MDNVKPAWLTAWKNKRHKRKKIAIVISHAIFLLICTISLQYTSYVRDDERTFLKEFSSLKHDVLKIDPKPLGDSVVFIDVSRDITLMPDPLRRDSIHAGKKIFAPA